MLMPVMTDTQTQQKSEREETEEDDGHGDGFFVCLIARAILHKKIT